MASPSAGAIMCYCNQDLDPQPLFHCWTLSSYRTLYYIYIYVHKYLYNPHGLETTVPSFWIARNNLGYHIRSLPFSPHVSWQHMPLAWSDHRPAFLLTSLSTFLPSSTILRGASELPGSGIIWHVAKPETGSPIQRIHTYTFISFIYIYSHS